MGGVIVVGGFLYYNQEESIRVIDDQGNNINIPNKPVGLIDSSSTEWTFFVEEDTRQEVSINIEEINETLIELIIDEHPDSTTGDNYLWNMALCNSEGSDVRLQEERGGGFDNSRTTPERDTLTNRGFNETWCNGGEGYILFDSVNKTNFPQRFRIITGNMTNFQLYAGTGSVLIDGDAGALASSGIGDNICRDINGVLHVAYMGADSDLWYGNSTDSGATWSTKELLASTVANVDITCGTNDNITIIFELGQDVDGFDSGNSGETFGSIFTAFDNAANLLHHSCDLDSNNVVHCVAGDSAALVYYTNSSTWNTIITLPGQTSNTSEFADIFVDIDDNVYIIGVGTADDDVDIWSDVDGWTTRNIIEDNLGASGARFFGTAVDVDGNIWYGGPHLNDLNICNGTTVNWDGGASAWTCFEPSTSESRETDVGISQANDIFFIHEDDNTDATSDLLRTNSSDGGITFESRTVIDNPSALFPSVANSLFPTSNRPNTVLEYVFSNSTGFNFNNFSIRSSVDTCTYTSGNWDVTCSDSCTITEDVNIDAGGNISLTGTGTFTINDGVNITGFTRLQSDRTCFIHAFGQGGFFQF